MTERTDKDEQIRTQEIAIANLHRRLAEAQRDVANLRRAHDGAQRCIDALRRENKRLQGAPADKVFGNG